jgi:hypothetical protein
MTTGINGWRREFKGEGGGAPSPILSPSQTLLKWSAKDKPV